MSLASSSVPPNQMMLRFARMRSSRNLAGPLACGTTDGAIRLPCVVALVVGIASCGGRVDDTDFARDMAGAAPSTQQVNSQESLGAAASRNAQAASNSETGAPQDGTGGSTPQTTFASSPADSANRSAGADDAFVELPSTTDPEEKPPSILTHTVAARDIVGDGGVCQVWLDVADSELIFGDISATFVGQSWLPVDECTQDAIGWQLTSDEQGTWLVPCPAACQLLAENPDANLYIEAEYWTEAVRVAR